MKKMLSLIFSFLLLSCQDDEIYHLEYESIESKIGFDQGFQIDKLVVDSVARFGNRESVSIDSFGNVISIPAIVKGFPKSYDVDSTILFNVMDNKETLKKVYFNKENSSCYWLILNSEIDKKYEKLPIRFLQDAWYRIRGLKGPEGDYEYQIFFQVTGKNRLKVFHEYRPGPY